MMLGWIKGRRKGTGTRDCGTTSGRIAAARARHEAHVAGEAAALARLHPGARLATQFIFWDSVWNGRHRALLTDVLGLTPFDAFNTRLIAADTVTSAALGLPIRHHGSIVAVAAQAEDHIDDLLLRAGIAAPEDLAADADARAAFVAALAELAEHHFRTNVVPTLACAGIPRAAPAPRPAAPPTRLPMPRGRSLAAAWTAVCDEMAREMEAPPLALAA